MQYLKQHLGVIFTVGVAALGGIGAVVAKLQKWEEAVVEAVMDKLLANPELHYILVKYRPQIEKAWEIATAAAKKKLDEAQ